jgi:hypothetical protein
MLKRLFIYVFGLVIGSGCLGNGLTPNQTDELKSKAKSFEAAYRAKCLELGYTAPVENTDDLKFYESDNDAYQEKSIRLLDDNYWLVFLEKSQHLIDFRNQKTSDLLFGQGAKTYATPTVPQWPAEKAVAMAKPFLPAFLGDRKVFLANPEPKYIHTILKNEGF